jgi:hypothetical protein
MMHDEYKQYVEADHERRGKFVQWLKKKISGTPPADLDSISDDKLDDVISDDDPGKAKMSGEFAPQAPARRVAVVYTDDEAKQLAESAAVIERAVEFIKDADAKKLQATAVTPSPAPRVESLFEPRGALLLQPCYHTPKKNPTFSLSLSRRRRTGSLRSV